MGDRYWMKITCREKDRDAFAEAGFEEEGAVEIAGAPSLATTGSIYTLDRLDELAAKGTPFFGVQEADEEGTAWCFAAYNKRLVRQKALRAYGFTPIVVVGTSGIADKESLAHANAYYEVLGKATLMIKGSVALGKQWKSADDILKQIDGPEFREQRVWLTKVVSALEKRQLVEAPDVFNWLPAAEALEGLQNLCDALADYAHDVLGKDCLCVTKEDEDG
jgi:hypothetical protein